ncbi:hypothetical protein F5B17DRAFT_382243 [Nemania serpens]|nr:hypothetical protein F5B17DRAFT_382243 [Nemania serpens]
MRNKSKIKDCSDAKILELCKENGRECNSLRWIDAQDIYIDINEYTVAIVIDMSASRGHIRVFNDKEEQIDMVGRNERGYTVILWVEMGCQYACFGPCRIAILKIES